MDQADPTVFASQLERMIAFADGHQEYVLGAWLSDALNRLNVIIEASQGLPSATE
jgi:hypothetical protein